MRNQIEYSLFGKYALFTDPITRVGGEKCTLQIPTYQALKGVTESIYWKPTIIWYIDELRVMKPIRTESKNIRLLKPSEKNKKTDLAIYTYLADVEYRVRAHFEFNMFRSEMESDRNENKHHNIAKRMVERGGRRDIFLGTRECQGYIEAAKFDDGEGYYDNYGELSFGYMFHGFNYPDENGDGKLSVRLWNARMRDGIIKFPSPKLFKENDPEYPVRVIRENVTVKKFIHGVNASFAEDDDELKIFAEGGGGQ